MKYPRTYHLPFSQGATYDDKRLGGSGSCAVACKLIGRNFIGCEKDGDMFKKAENWINNINYEEAENYIASKVKSKALF